MPVILHTSYVFRQLQSLQRNPSVFELIFLFYQSDGRYCYRPPHIDLMTFCDEIMFFGLYQEYKTGPTVGIVNCELDFSKFSQKANMGSA